MYINTLFEVRKYLIILVLSVWYVTENRSINNVSD